MTNVTVTVSHEEPVMSHQAGWARQDTGQRRSLALALALIFSGGGPCPYQYSAPWKQANKVWDDLNISM